MTATCQSKCNIPCYYFTKCTWPSVSWTWVKIPGMTENWQQIGLFVKLMLFKNTGLFLRRIKLFEVHSEGLPLQTIMPFSWSIQAGDNLESHPTVSKLYSKCHLAERKVGGSSWKMSAIRSQSIEIRRFIFELIFRFMPSQNWQNNWYRIADNYLHAKLDYNSPHWTIVGVHIYHLRSICFISRVFLVITMLVYPENLGMRFPNLKTTGI